MDLYVHARHVGHLTKTEKRVQLLPEKLSSLAKMTEWNSSSTNASLQMSDKLTIEPEIALPESLEFSVYKCTAEDKAIGSKITILDTCPLFPGLNFRFKNEQKVDQNAVDFSFTSFVFPSSAENTIIELTCDINI
ncbi:unnamed protein product [Oikopleura dioica]|uniref:ZP domain-containing protein n=1 Tax=Oikopleura dioica TaxID=34765 RepID=E4YD50_OIKDI|nr:unnamed protein product [Oikopleura dioica]